MVFKKTAYGLRFTAHFIQCTWHRVLLPLAGLALLSACAHLPPLPESFDPGAYRPISFQDLRHPGPAGLTDGQKVKTPAYFWQFVRYDPAPLANYPNLARYPLTWHWLEWAALYGASDMKEYYDRVVMTMAQKKTYSLKRLDHVMVYGELAQLAPGFLYLRVNHIDRIQED